jgi:hypothetical protein
LATKTITGSYPTGYALNPSFDTLNVASTATVEGTGITTTKAHPSTINNLGSVHGTANGITLSDGGVITNGNAGNTTALIQGVTAIVANNASATIKNSATIKSDAVYSGGYKVTRASIVLNQGGAIVNVGTGQIANGLKVLAASGAVTNIGTIGSPTKTKTTSQTDPNGDRTDTSFTQAYASVQMTAGGSVVNGAGGVTSSKISNGISITGAVGTVSNFGTIRGTHRKQSISHYTTQGSYLPQIREQVTKNYGPSIVLSAGTITNASGAAISDGITIGTAKIVNNGSISHDQPSTRSAYYYSVSNVPMKDSITDTSDYAISVSNGGSLVNGSTSNKAATLSGGIKVFGASGTIVNHGKISGSYSHADYYYYNNHSGNRVDRSETHHGYSIRLMAGGQVTNGGASNAAATIGNGIYISGGIGKVVNHGTIAGGAGYDIYRNGSFYTDPYTKSVSGASIKLTAGGEVTNGSAGNTAARTEHGISIDGGIGKVLNYGTIQYISLHAGGIVTNGSATSATALISNGIGITGAGTITNFGTIKGGATLSSPGARLIEQGGGVLIGNVVAGGGTLQLAGAAGAGTLTGLGNTITGFATVTVDAGAAWSLSGTSKVAASTQLTNNGTLGLLGYVINSGKIINAAGATLAFKGNVSITTDPAVGASQFTNAGLVQKLAGTGTSIIRTGNASLIDTGIIDVQKGTLALTGKSVTIAGLVKGAGTIQFGPGSNVLTTLQTGAAITTAGWNLAGANAQLTVARNLAYAGKFAASAHTTLTIATGRFLQLSRAASFTADTVKGAGRLTTEGSTTISQVTFNGTGQWWNTGMVTETGQLTLGHVGTQGSVFLNRAGGVFNIAANSGIAGTVASSTFTNQGLLAKTAGTLSTIAAQVVNTGIIEARSGTLDLQRAVSGTGGILKIDGGKTLQADAAVSAGQTVDFNGGNDKLVLTDAAHFAAKLQDFGAADRLDLRQFHLATTTLAYAENPAGTVGVLTVTDGALTAKINLLGQYMAAGFHKASDGAGGIFVTYTPQAAMALAPPHG